MFKQYKSIAIGILGVLASATVVADDGDVQHSRVLLEEARMFGVPDATGLAAGQIDDDADAQGEPEPELSANEQRWEDILETQSIN